MIGFFSSLSPIWEKYKAEIILLISSLVIVFISSVIYIKSSASSEKEEEVTIKEQKPEAIKTPFKQIVVDLSGAVEKPDVYEITSGARLKDLLILANGLSSDTDREFFNRNFNLARILKDQDKIYIPSVNEVQTGAFKEPVRLVDLTEAQVFDPTPVDPSRVLSASTMKININTANATDLDSLSGIGLSTAQKIIQSRPYTSIEELLDKKIVKKNVYEKIKELISVD